jgi:hypothetical protein
LKYRKIKRPLLYFTILPLVDFNFFLDIVSGVGSLFLAPVLLWVAYFLCGYYLDYPADLEKQIKDGKIWPYLPMHWKGKRKTAIRAASTFLFWAANITGACAIYYLSSGVHAVVIILGFGGSIFIGLKVRLESTKKILRLQQDRYFQIYTKLASQAMSKGNEISDNELLSKTQWQHHSDLRQADKQGRLLQYLKGEAML